MTQFVCPGCQVLLDTDWLAQNETAKCPFCGEDLPSFEFVVDTADGVSGLSETPEALQSTGPPTGSKGQIVESNDERKVIFVPAGGRRVRGLGVMALVWNSFMAVISCIMLVAQGANEIKGLSLLVVIPFIGLFWAVGLGFLIY